MTRQAVQTKSFQIIADSGCNLPPWLIRRFKIFTVPTSYYSRRSPQNEELFDVNFGFDAQSFYARMKMGEDFVFNPLNASTCVRFIDPLIEETDDDVLFLFASSAISSNSESVLSYFDEVSMRYPNRTFKAVDTLSVSLGFGRLLMWACELREDGASIEAVAKWVGESRLGMSQWFLEGAQQSLIHVNNSGKLYPPVEHPRGRSLTEIYKHRSAVPYNKYNPSIVHADNRDAALQLASQLDEYFGVPNSMIYDVEPCLGSRLGPGTLGLIFWGGPR